MVKFNTAQNLIDNGFHNRFNELVFVKKELIGGWKAAMRCRRCFMFGEVIRVDLEPGRNVTYKCINCMGSAEKPTINEFNIKGIMKEWKEVLA